MAYMDKGTSHVRSGQSSWVNRGIEGKGHVPKKVTKMECFAAIECILMEYINGVHNAQWINIHLLCDA